MTSPAAPALAIDDGDARLWRGYIALCALCWLLYAMAVTEWDRGWRLWDGVYEATLNLAPPIALGAFALPWLKALRRRPRGAIAASALHLAGALVFALAWQLVDFVVAWLLFGHDHATATFQQRVLWRAMWGVFAYGALVSGFGSALHARLAQRTAIAAARAEAALVRAELANISGKLNPHFLFNTLNSILILTRTRRRPPPSRRCCASRAMMRYVLDTTRSAGDRVAARGRARLRARLPRPSRRCGSVTACRSTGASTRPPLADEIPPLTLQPLVENSIVHGIAPKVEGGTVTIAAHRRADADALELRRRRRRRRLLLAAGRGQRRRAASA